MNDADLVDANREQAFPQIRDSNDTGEFQTEIKIVVPYKIHRDRRRGLIESLQVWAVKQGLEEPEPYVLLTYIIQDVEKS